DGMGTNYPPAYHLRHDLTLPGSPKSSMNYEFGAIPRDHPPAAVQDRTDRWIIAAHAEEADTLLCGPSAKARAALGSLGTSCRPHGAQQVNRAYTLGLMF